MGTPGDLAVRREGDGKPVLIIHGWTMNGAVEAFDFEPAFGNKTEYQRIYVDLPGMGETPAGGITDLDSILQQLFLFIDSHIAPSEFLVTGTSCGAYLARAVAYKYDKLVQGLLLRVPLVEPITAHRDLDPFETLVPDSSLMNTLPADINERLFGIPVQTAEYIQNLQTKLDDVCFPAEAAANHAVLGPIRDDHTRYRLKSPLHTVSDPFLSPALILTGRQDTDVGYRDAWKLSPMYPRASFVALDRATHAFPVDESPLFRALVQDWLTRVEENRRAERQA